MLFPLPAKKKREVRPPLPKIEPDFEDMVWIGELGKEVETWKGIFPFIDVEQQVLNALEYAKAHPEKRYSRWYSYLSSWLARQNQWAMEKQQGGGRARLA